MAEDQAAGVPSAAETTILALGAGEAGPAPCSRPQRLAWGWAREGADPLQRPQQRPRGGRPRPSLRSR